MYNDRVHELKPVLCHEISLYPMHRLGSVMGWVVLELLMSTYLGFFSSVVECLVPAVLPGCYFRHSLKKTVLFFYEIFSGD